MAADMETVRRRIEDLIKERGMSARGLSLAIGQNEAYIQQLTSGLRNKKPPSVAIMQAISDKLGVPLMALLDDAPVRQVAEPIGALLDRLGVQKMADPVGQMEEFGASLGDDDRRTKLPQDIEYTLPKRQRGKKGTQYRAIVAYGQCMNGAIPDGSVVLFEDHGHAEPGALVVAVLDGEQVTVKRLVEDGGERYLVSEQGHRYHVNGDVRLVGPVRLVMQRF